jgi:hypothetical protein
MRTRNVVHGMSYVGCRTWGVERGVYFAAAACASMRPRGNHALVVRLVIDWRRISYARPPSLQQTQ